MDSEGSHDSGYHPMGITYYCIPDWLSNIATNCGVARLNKRKVAYLVVYTCVAFAFPALPLGGLEFIGDMISGVFVSVKQYAGEGIKDFLLSWLI